ncbi:hypothetical protein ACP70R_048824 [Stipagrostis hirtigluma subsp. patula]
MSPRLLMLLAVAAAVSLAADDEDDTLAICSTSGNYTDRSPYEKNLKDLVSNLSTSASRGNGWFYSAAAGAAPDRAWGLVMCYADCTAAQCLDCLRYASHGWLRKVCPHSRNMSVYYGAGGDGSCFLRYADAPFLGSAAGAGEDDSTTYYYWTHQPVVADMAGMREARRRLLGRLAGGAGEQPLRLSSGNQTYTDARGDSQAVYGLAQCTRDLPPGECAGCLGKLLGKVPSDVTKGTVNGVSCYLRYQVNEPIHITDPAAPAPSSPQNSGAPPPAGSTGFKTPVIAAVAAAAGTVVTLLADV